MLELYHLSPVIAAAFLFAGGLALLWFFGRRKRLAEGGSEDPVVACDLQLVSAADGLYVVTIYAASPLGRPWAARRLTIREPDGARILTRDKGGTNRDTISFGYESGMRLRVPALEGDYDEPYLGRAKPMERFAVYIPETVGDGSTPVFAVTISLEAPARDGAHEVSRTASAVIPG